MIDASTIPGHRRSVIPMPDYEQAKGYRFIKPVLRDNRIVWQGCHTRADALAGRWEDIGQGGNQGENQTGAS